MVFIRAAGYFLTHAFRGRGAWFALFVNMVPEGVRLTAIMDCCHSGTGLDLPCAGPLRDAAPPLSGAGGETHTG